MCSGSCCLCLLLLGGLTRLRCCAVGGLTHLQTQVFTTLATLAPFIHTPRLLKVSLPSVVVATLAPFIHTPRLLKVSLPSVVVATLAPFIHTPRLLKVSLPSVIVVFFLLAAVAVCSGSPVFGELLPLSTAARWPHPPAVLCGRRPHPPADSGIHHTCHISTVYSHTTLAKSLFTICCYCVLFTCRSRGVFGKPCVREVVAFCLLLLGGLTRLRCCAVGGLTHLRTQVFTTLATLAPFIHTPRLLKVSLPSVVVVFLLAAVAVCSGSPVFGKLLPLSTAARWPHLPAVGWLLSPLTFLLRY